MNELIDKAKAENKNLQDTVEKKAKQAYYDLSRFMSSPDTAVTTADIEQFRSAV